MPNFNFSFPVILDIIVVGLLILFALRGRRRGLIRTIAGILILILAFVGAGYLADTTTPYISKNYVEKRITKALEPEVSHVADFSKISIADMLVKIGIPEGLSRDIAKNLPVNSALSQVSQSVAARVTYAVLCVAYFLLLLIVLSLVMRLINGIAKLPGLNFINKAGGLLCGLVFGYLAIMLGSSILLSTGLFIAPDVVSKTQVLKFISQTNPLGFIKVESFWS